MHFYCSSQGQSEHFYRVNAQELTSAGLMSENPEHIYHAAMLDPRTAAELDLNQIWSMVDALRVAHGDWLPKWVRM
jgi:alpha-galactosidase